MVDAGDFCGAISDAQRQKVGYLVRGMAMLNYTAVNIADKDLLYGRDFLVNLQDEHGLTLVSANVYMHGTGDLFARPYVIKEVGDKKVGIFGVTKPLFPEKMAAAGFEIQDPVAAARRIVQELKGKSDMVLALAHLGLNQAKNLAGEVPGIDVIISGHNRSLSTRPEMVGETVVMQAGAQGKYLGQLDLWVGDDKIEVAQGKCVPLNDKIADDERLSHLVKEYDQAVAPGHAGTH